MEDEPISMKDVNPVGFAPHGQIIALPSLWARDGQQFYGAAIYDANAALWHTVIEAQLDDSHLINSEDDQPFASGSLMEAMARGLLLMATVCALYDGDDEDGGIAVPVPILN